MKSVCLSFIYWAIFQVTLQANAATLPDGNILEVASAKGLTTFLSLLNEATLTEAFKKDGQCTAFAPSNDAFLALNTTFLQQLKSNPDQLKNILLSHVIKGKFLSKDLTNGMVATAINGANLTCTIRGTEVMVNNAKVTTADVEASNGVIHIIDAVIIPPLKNESASLPPKSRPARSSVHSAESHKMGHENIVEEAKAAGFSKLVDLITQAGLVDTLAKEGPFTVFAPTKEALAKLDSNLKPEQIKKILENHIISGTVNSHQITNGLSSKSLSGDLLTFAVNNKNITVNGILILKTDIKARNGVIHVIGSVIQPA